MRCVLEPPGVAARALGEHCAFLKRLATIHALLDELIARVNALPSHQAARRCLAPQGHPTSGAGACVVNTWPVRGASIMFAGPCHSAAIMNSVLLSGHPSVHAKQPRSSSMVCSTSP